MSLPFFQPILAIRMVLESILFPIGDRDFSGWAPATIQEEIQYGNAGTVMITRSREVSAFPIPVNLYRLQKKGKREEYENFGKTLVERGRADFGELNLSNPLFTQHARGIDAA